MVRYINSLGLSAGLYTARGQHTCAGYAASCGYEAQDALLYASWGMEYVKDDNCGACHSDSYLQDYGAMQQGIWATGAAMWLSVEGDPPVQVITNGGYGQMKRVGHDIQANYPRCAQAAMMAEAAAAARSCARECEAGL